MILALGMVLDAWLGEPKWLWNRFPHPAILMGRAIGWCDTTFNHGNTQRQNGTLVIVALVAAALITGWLIALLPWPVEAVIVAILLAQRSLVDHVRAVGAGLRISLQKGREDVAKIVGRDTDEMDQSSVARAAIESAAENLSDGVIAPITWYLILGLPGLVAYKMINTADSMIGYRTDKHRAFGWASARLDDLVNWLPARLTAVLILAGQFRFELWSLVRRDAKLHRSPNAGWPEAAMAGVLGIALSGPRSYDGQISDQPFVNPAGKRTLGPQDIDAAVSVLWQVWVIMLATAFLMASI